VTAKDVGIIESTEYYTGSSRRYKVETLSSLAGRVNVKKDNVQSGCLIV